MIEKKDFSYSYYKKTLLKLKETHKFSFFDTFTNNDVILRHDVDFALQPALEMAKLESKIGVCSTYFILFNSPFYNPFSSSSSKIIRKIINLGHKIGLHYDISFFSENKLDINETILQELELFSQHFKAEINLISSHNPTINKKISLNLGKQIIDADSTKLKAKRKYISDSVQNWREGTFSKFVNIPELYILIHPIWWTKKNEKRVNILKSFVKNGNTVWNNDIENIIKMQRKYLARTKKFIPN